MAHKSQRLAGHQADGHHQMNGVARVDDILQDVAHEPVVAVAGMRTNRRLSTGGGLFVKL